MNEIVIILKEEEENVFFYNDMGRTNRSIWDWLNIRNLSK